MPQPQPIEEKQNLSDIELIESPTSLDSGVKTPSYEAEEITFIEGLSYADVEHEQRIRHDNELHLLRQTMMAKIYRLICEWLVFVALIIAASGFKIWDFGLSDSVLIALLTTSTATVIGIFIIAANWLFPKK